MSTPNRAPVRIRFKYNMDTGEVEEFIVDDSTPTASEDYHQKVADVIARRLAANPDIEDAGTGSRTPGVNPILVQPVEGIETETRDTEDQTTG